MIPTRLPWRHRARPSATLHEMSVCSEEQTCDLDDTKRQEVRQVELSRGRAHPHRIPLMKLKCMSEKRNSELADRLLQSREDGSLPFPFVACPPFANRSGVIHPMRRPHA